MRIAARDEKIVIGGNRNDFLRSRARQLQRTLDGSREDDKSRLPNMDEDRPRPGCYPCIRQNQCIAELFADDPSRHTVDIDNGGFRRRPMGSIGNRSETIIARAAFFVRRHEGLPHCDGSLSHAESRQPHAGAVAATGGQKSRAKDGTDCQNWSATHATQVVAM